MGRTGLPETGVPPSIWLASGSTARWRFTLQVEEFVMVARGRVQNGVVVSADGVRLPEGKKVTVLASAWERHRRLDSKQP